jgi:hypothetical protein
MFSLDGFSCTFLALTGSQRVVDKNSLAFKCGISLLLIRLAIYILYSTTNLDAYEISPRMRHRFSTSRVAPLKRTTEIEGR